MRLVVDLPEVLGHSGGAGTGQQGDFIDAEFGALIAQRLPTLEGIAETRQCLLVRRIRVCVQRGQRNGRVERRGVATGGRPSVVQYGWLDIVRTGGRNLVILVIARYMKNWRLQEALSSTAVARSFVFADFRARTASGFARRRGIRAFHGDHALLLVAGLRRIHRPLRRQQQHLVGG